MNNTLTRSDIINAIYHETDIMRKDVKVLVEFLLTTMKTAIKRDNALLVTGFGKFEAYAKKARIVRNPQTNEAMTLAPRKVVVYRMSKKFRA